eukprot:5278064-Prymnesium_polylepis.1
MATDHGGGGAGEGGLKPEYEVEAAAGSGGARAARQRRARAPRVRGAVEGVDPVVGSVGAYKCILRTQLVQYGLDQRAWLAVFQEGYKSVFVKSG